MFRFFLGLFLLFLATPLLYAETEETPPLYLLLDMEFKLLERNVLGTYPRLHGQALLDRLARPAMTSALESFTQGRLVSIEDMDTSGIEKLDESLALFDRFTQIPRHYFEPGGDSDFFEAHEPLLRLGPVFSKLSHNGTQVDRAIKISLVQVLWDREAASDLYAIYSDKRRVLEVCTFDLNDGSLLWCAYRKQDDNLFDRNGVWKKDYYEAEVHALFNDPQSTYYRKAEK